MLRWGTSEKVRIGSNSEIIMQMESEDSQPVSYWPSVSDLFMTLFIVSLVFTGVLCYAFLPRSAKSTKVVFDAVGGVSMPKIFAPTNKIRRALGPLPNLPELQSGLPAADVVRGLSDTADAAEQHLRDLVPRSVADDLRNQLANVSKELAESKRQLAEARKTTQEGDLEIETLRKQIGELQKDDGPMVSIITKDTNEEYVFDSGSAVMSKAFSDGLKKKAEGRSQGEFEKLKSQIKSRNAGGKQAVDTLEIVGHTDGQPVNSSGNLDQKLPLFLTKRDRQLKGMIAGSNNDLGLMRALAIQVAWEEFVASQPEAERHQLREVKVRSYSAGQTIPPTDIALDDPKLLQQENEAARRIEVRLTKLGGQLPNRGAPPPGR
jgi:flagellar motor protein MotB